MLTGDVPEPGQPAVGLPVPHPLLAQARARRGAGVDTSACVEQEPLLQIRSDSGAEHPVACHFAKTVAVV